MVPVDEEPRYPCPSRPSFPGGIQAPGVPALPFLPSLPDLVPLGLAYPEIPEVAVGGTLLVHVGAVVVNTVRVQPFPRDLKEVTLYL